MTINKKEIMICLHGFGKKRTRELDFIKDCLGNEIEIVMPNLFDPADSLDDDAVVWTNRAYLFIEDYIIRGYDVILLGFSMGGVMATYCAAKLPVKKCILLAPAFDLINLKNVNNILTTLTRPDTLDETKNFNDLPASFYHTLFDVVLNYRDYAKELSVPVLILHGVQDSIVSYRSSRHSFSLMPAENKQLILLEKGHHVLTEDNEVKKEIIELIRLFLNDRIVIH